MLAGIFPFFMCQNPCIRIPHWRPKAAMSMLKPTLLNPYFFRKVIRKPNPTNIITWTSWKSERKTCLCRDCEEWLWRVKSKGQRQLEGRRVPNSSHACDPFFPHHDQSTSWKLNGCKIPHLIIDYIDSCIIMETHWNFILASLLVSGTVLSLWSSLEHHHSFMSLQKSYVLLPIKVVRASVFWLSPKLYMDLFGWGLGVPVQRNAWDP